MAERPCVNQTNWMQWHLVSDNEHYSSYHGLMLIYKDRHIKRKIERATAGVLDNS